MTIMMLLMKILLIENEDGFLILFFFSFLLKFSILFCFIFLLKLKSEIKEQMKKIETRPLALIPIIKAKHSLLHMRLLF